jgi:uncharacterized membrane protein
MIVADIVLGARNWLGPAILLSGAAIALLVWSTIRTTRPGWVRNVSTLLKAAAIAMLGVCLVEPLYTGTRPRPGSNLFLVVADTSRSLELSNQGAGKSRGAVVQEQLRPESGWLTRLAQDFDVRRYAFDANVRPVEDFSKLAFTGEASQLRITLSSITDRFRGQPVAGILVLTDGNATDIGSNSVDWKSMPPIFPVAVASETESLDVAVSSVSVTQTNLDAAPVTILAEIDAHKAGGKKIVAKVLNEEGKEVERRVLAGSEQKTAERFLIKPEKPGVSFYTVEACLEEEEKLAPDSGRSVEATRANNRRLATVDRGGGPYRVLYVTGTPNWEFKFLRRSLEKEDEVRLLGLVRVAKKEPKFNFLSRGGESTNPLFRGFGNDKDDTAEQFDEAVMIRLGADDADELKGGFPKEADELFRYHAVVLDDIEAGFFTQDQLSLMERFVSQRGGGLLMLGGKDSYAEGGYPRTPVGDMLPVYLDRTAPVANAAYRLKLTREGWLQPWVRVRANESDEEKRLAAMPAFQSMNRIEAIKPGASILAEVDCEDGSTRPALAVQPFGRGRVGAMMIGDLWRWELRKSDPKESDLEKSWRQTMRWLVADVPQRVEVEVKRTGGAGMSPMELVIRTRDKQFAPLDNAAVTVTIQTPEKKEIQIAAESSRSSPGEYVASFSPRVAGAYRAEIRATAADGSDVGRRETGWAVEPETEEFQKLSGNRSLLDQMAKDSGGEVIDVNRLDAFISSLPNRKIPVTETWTYPLWHQWSVVTLAMLCLVGEWGLRRWKGMA